MAKQIQDVVRALKLKADSKAGALSVKVGTRKVSLPFDVRVLESSEYLFVHLPPAAAIFKVSKEGVTLIEDSAEASAANAAFRKPRKRKGQRANESVDMPDALVQAMKAIPAGYRLQVEKDGSARLVKMRKARKSG